MKYKFGKINNKDVVIFNVSDGFSNWTQKKNEYVLKKGKSIVNANSTCNVTAYVNGLQICGYSLESDKYPELSRMSDKLAKFICEDPGMDQFYKEKAYAAWLKWNRGDEDAYTPVEIHQVLCEGVNRFYGGKSGDIASFNADTPIKDILNEIVIEQYPVITSGKFTYKNASGKLTFINHVVCLVGFVYEKSLVEPYLKDDDLFYKNVICNNEIDSITGKKKFNPSFAIIDDSWGETKNYALNKIGNDSIIPYDSFISDVKPCGDTRVKFAHIFRGSIAKA